MRTNATSHDRCGRGCDDLKSLLHQGLSEPEFYGDLVYKFEKIRGMTDQFQKFLNTLQTYWL